MNHIEALDTVTSDQLTAVTGGAGIGSQIGSMFGAQGAKWGGIADSIMGIVGQASGGAGIGGILGKLGGGGGGGAPSGGQPPQPSAGGAPAGG